MTLEEFFICPGLVHVVPAKFAAFADGLLKIPIISSVERIRDVLDFIVLPIFGSEPTDENVSVEWRPGESNP